MKNKISILFGFFSLFLWAALLYSPSWAGEPYPVHEDGKNSPEAPVVLESVTVTAHKRLQQAGDIPDSISVLTDIDLEDASVKDMESLSIQVPGLEFYSFGSRRHSLTFMRGIKSLHTGEPATGYYVDGVNYPRSYMFDFPLFDVERIEILKGPQGILYGKNTMGGVINIHTRQPNNETVARLGLEYSSEKLKRANGSLSAPLVPDTLFISLAGTAFSRDGYMKNKTPAPGEDGRHAEGGAGRIKLKYRPCEDLNINLGLDLQDYEGGAFPFRRTERNMFVKKMVLSEDPAYHYSHDFEGTAEDRFWGTSLTADYRFKGHTLSWITGYRDYRNRESIDTDFSPFDMTRLNYGQEEESFTQEIRLASPESNILEWLVGAYYFHNESDNTQEHEYRAGMSGQPGNPFGTGTGSRILDSRGKNEGAALFGQATLMLPVNLELTAGLRYEHEDATMDRTSTDSSDSGIPGQTVFPGASNKFDALLPKTSLAWHFRKHHMIYATFSCWKWRFNS